VNTIVYTHIAVGNVNIDITLYTEKPPQIGDTVLASSLKIRPGGAALNYAVTVAQYGHRVYLVARASSHVLARKVLEKIKQYGVRVESVKLVEGAPGVVVVLVDKSGERTMIKYPGVNEELKPSDLELSLLRGAHVLHVASVKPDVALGFLELGSREGIVTTLDPGGYVAEWSSDLLVKALKHTHTLFLNEQSFCTQFRALSIDKFFKYGLSVLVIKRGGKGAVVLTQSRCYSGYAEPIKRVVDTTGAGDAFNAFFNAKYLESKDPGLSLVYGLAAGTLKTGFRGGFMKWNSKLFELQLEKVVVERRSCSEVVLCTES
jgi:ribokinase